METERFDGLLVVDKPGGMTSRAALDRALRWFPRRTRMGHTGTLDPLATGVLVLCAGSATRLAEYVQRMPKTYRTTLHLGARSDTDDADGAVTVVANAVVPSNEMLKARLSKFIGTIEQVPPAFSAAKVTGRRAYDLARQGEQVDLRPRPVRIDRIDVHHFEYPKLELEIHCGKGTYIRSLARDLGERLGCGAYVKRLRRTAVGPFTERDAISLDADMTTARSKLQPLDAALIGMPRVTLSGPEVNLIAQGRSLENVTMEAADASEVGLFDHAGSLVAVAEYDKAGRCLRPEKVFA